MNDKQLKEDTRQQQKNENISLWRQIVESIVRPPIRQYQSSDLGEKQIKCFDKFYTRNDYQVDHQGKFITLTVYESHRDRRYVILYLHGNSSCRIESQCLLRYLPDDVSLAAFDFMGCGNNKELETVSLGYREAQQTKSITEFLIKKGFFVILWGRSMGAAASLLYGKAEFIVADSAFKTFKSACKHVAKSAFPIPNCLIDCFFPCVFKKLRYDVDKRAHYDIQDLDVQQAVKKLDPSTTVVFMSGKDDDLVNAGNSQKLYNICPVPANQKHLLLFDGDHNSRRPDKQMKQVMKFIQDFICEKSKNFGSEKTKSSIASDIVLLDFSG